MIYIKKASVPDASTISFLGRQTFRETFSELFNQIELNKYLEDTFSIKKLENSLLKKQNIFGILYYQDKPVGYYKVKTGIHYNNSLNERYFQLQKIYVLRDYLQLKLGKLMLEDVLHLNEIIGCEKVWLVVLNTNYRAIKFYENNGFKKISKHYHIIGRHRLEYELMIRNLKNSYIR
jgi:ribosomal protein S18 acetylase RimI-like enzyme